jgi:hypothetical protein
MLVACATVRTVRKSDLDAWVGISAEALDTHSFFLTLPMVRTVTPSGIEVRNYPNKRSIGRCFHSGGANFNSTLSYAAYQSFATCATAQVGCDNIFYLRNGVVVEYAPTGRCSTDERVRPEARFERLMK